MAIILIVGLAVFVASVTLWAKAYTLHKTLKSNQQKESKMPTKDSNITMSMSLLESLIKMQKQPGRLAHEIIMAGESLAGKKNPEGLSVSDFTQSAYNVLTKSGLQGDDLAEAAKVYDELFTACVPEKRWTRFVDYTNRSTVIAEVVAKVLSGKAKTAKIIYEHTPKPAEQEKPAESMWTKYSAEQFKPDSILIGSREYKVISVLQKGIRACSADVNPLDWRKGEPVNGVGYVANKPIGKFKGTVSWLSDSADKCTITVDKISLSDNAEPESHTVDTLPNNVVTQPDQLTATLSELMKIVSTLSQEMNEIKAQLG